LRSRDVLHAYFSAHAAFHVYALGDLDDFYWPHCAWYGWEQKGVLQAVALLYQGFSCPVLLAVSPHPRPDLKDLVTALRPTLARTLYAHLNPGLIHTLEETYQARAHGRHYKMALRRPKLPVVAPIREYTLCRPGKAELAAFYQEVYPACWYDPDSARDPYLGVRQGKELLAVAGVHVVSRRFRVAALGNVATHPNFRGLGLATVLVGHLCRELFGYVDVIGLNVACSNEPAIACYRKLGFEVQGVYEEYMLERNHESRAAGKQVKYA